MSSYSGLATTLLHTHESATLPKNGLERDYRRYRRDEWWHHLRHVMYIGARKGHFSIITTNTLAAARKNKPGGNPLKVGDDHHHFDIKVSTYIAKSIETSFHSNRIFYLLPHSVRLSSSSCSHCGQHNIDDDKRTWFPFPLPPPTRPDLDGSLLLLQ